MTRLKADQWSTYWRKGSVTTFQDAFQGNYDGEVKDFWETVFVALPKKARLVDLACGNGALALLASTYSHANDRVFDIDAIDFAVIQPLNNIENKNILQSISFYSNCRIEESRLPAESYDIAISQFGMEYGDPELAVKELDRILKKRGSIFAALAHHDNSAIIQQAKTALKSIAICKKSNAPRLVAELQKTLEQVRKAQENPAENEICERLRSQLNEAIGVLHTQADQYKDPRHFEFFIRACMAPFGQTAMRTQSLEQRLSVLDRAEEENLAFEARMEDLLSAAMSDGDIRFLINQFENYGFTLSRSTPFLYKGEDFAYALIMNR